MKTLWVMSSFKMPVEISDKEHQCSALTFIGMATMYDKLPSLVSMKAFYKKKMIKDKGSLNNTGK